MHERRLRFEAPDQTSDFARAIAGRLRPGDVILLEGGLGVGKTHFARAAIQAMLSEIEDVPSPTFTLVQTYDGQNGEIWHADLYRISDAADADELGLEDAFEDAICFIEWPDRLGEMAPRSALTLRLEIAEPEGARHAVCMYRDPKWDMILGDEQPL